MPGYLSPGVLLRSDTAAPETTAAAAATQDLVELAVGQALIGQMTELHSFPFSFPILSFNRDNFALHLDTLWRV